MAEENLKTKGTELEEETGFWNRLNIPLPERSAGPFRYLRDFFTCLEFLTRIRMTKREMWFPDDFARSVPYFPLVGAIIGVLMWGAAHVGTLAGFSGNVLGVFLVLAELFFIGTLMYDGFMDTSDGVFSGRTRERKLEIMQDSHVGANAVIGAIILILAKVVLLGSFRTFMRPLADARLTSAGTAMPASRREELAARVLRDVLAADAALFLNPAVFSAFSYIVRVVRLL